MHISLRVKHLQKEAKKLSMYGNIWKSGSLFKCKGTGKNACKYLNLRSECSCQAYLVKECALVIVEKCRGNLNSYRGNVREVCSVQCVVDRRVFLFVVISRQNDYIDLGGMFTDAT